MFKKTLTILCCTLISGCFSQAAFAAQKNTNGNAGQPNGKPWQEVYSQLETMQSMIDDLVGQVDSLEEGVGAYEDAISALESENAELQALIDQYSGDIEELKEQIALNTTMIGLLQNQIAQINKALELKQNLIAGNCPAGEAVSQVNVNGSVVCQVVSGSAAQTTTFRVYNSVNVGLKAFAEVDVTCPDGSSFAGGDASLALTHWYPSYRAQLGGTLLAGSTMTATAHGPYYGFPNILTAFAVCVQ